MTDDKKPICITLDYELPPYPKFEEGIRRAPKRESHLSEADKELAIRNALRYIHPDHHKQMAEEFAKELEERGRIYGYRFRPEGKLYGKPIEEYKGVCTDGKAMQVMIDNNLDFDVALYPYELVTYGETGQVCQNWMQYRLIKKYLEIITDEQTLVMMSGHPMGLYKSHKMSPRVITTNALMVGMFDSNDNFNRAAAIGVANYGQMTAGGWMYIGPQGIVHGTFNTLLNAGRLKLGIDEKGNLAGKLFISAGLGGMSGAQGKACIIAGGVCIIAEVDESRIKTRHDQGWVSCRVDSCEEAVKIAKEKLEKKEPYAIAYYGNIVDLLQYVVDNNIHVDLLSDQTSCHVPYDGGYCPQGLTFEQRTKMLDTDRDQFKILVNKTLLKHYHLIQELHKRGTYFFDYGNSFLKAVYDAGEKTICKNGENDLDGFIFPSYVEDILGPQLFDYGYGPFRWCCLSRNPEDLDKTDKAAENYINEHNRRYQDEDNRVWVRDAKKNSLVVGTQCRILYQDAMGRTNIALKFNEMVRNKEIGPVMLGRDHHDTGGTDSPFRETSNIKDGSNIMADMAHQCFAGNCARGMSLVALHNGGGTGVGKAINGGFGMVLDGSERVDNILKKAMPFDTMIGVSRRSWAGNEHAIEVSKEYNEMNKGSDYITIPYIADEKIVKEALAKVQEEREFKHFTIIKNIGLLATAEGKEKKCGEEQGKIKFYKNAYIIIDGETIKEIGEGEPKGKYQKIIDAKGKLVTAGLVDPHTHLVFGGWRENELADKLKGKTYLEILEAGGGILSTVKNTRNSSKEELIEKTKKVLDKMLKLGVTTVEAKSGYGLDLDNELKMLEVVKSLNETHPIDLVSTFMGAHALPTEYKEKREDFIKLIIEKMIPEVADKKLAEFIDAFCEKGVFTPEECKRILQAGKDKGLRPKCHTDEIEPIGGTEMASELQAISCEHLIKATEQGILALSKNGTIACLLPNTSFYLGATFAPAKDMIKNGVAVAFGTDFNPGSCPSSNMQLAMNMGCLKYKMTPEECLTAVTLNAAAAINRGDKYGTVEVGKIADLLIWDSDNLNYLFYRFGDNLVKTVIKKGKIVAEN